jgi:hypothetical protein
MGTRADFYVGRGASAEWIGSMARDGYPDTIDKKVVQCRSEKAFRRAVTNFLNSRDDTRLPEDGWPWTWKDSRMTDFAYAYDAGAVHASCFGRSWFDPRNKEDNREPKATFPDMSRT